MTLEPSAEEANAVVYAITCEIVHSEAGSLEASPHSSPGDLACVADHCRRIAGLAAVNDQLFWRVHFGPTGGEPPAVTAPEAVWLDVAAILHDDAEDQRRHAGEDGYEDELAYDGAARSIARTFAEGTA
ncbi:MAG: hypothetical protein ACR2NB_06375 [Solirubrobacteraceae bacterium]